MINKIVKRTIKAFTLAEVLVTLGVIGVIAALTLPQLIRDFQGKILHAQLLKAYSVLSQALERMSVEENQVVAGNPAKVVKTKDEKTADKTKLVDDLRK